MNRKIDIVDNNVTYSYSFSFTERELSVQNTYKFNIWSKIRQAYPPKKLFFQFSCKSAKLWS